MIFLICKLKTMVTDHTVLSNVISNNCLLSSNTFSFIKLEHNNSQGHKSEFFANIIIHYIYIDIHISIIIHYPYIYIVNPTTNRRTISTPSMRASDDFVLVAAIDLGTTFSGYAFSTRSTVTETRLHENIRVNKSWGENLGFQVCLLKKIWFIYMVEVLKIRISKVHNEVCD